MKRPTNRAVNSPMNRLLTAAVAAASLWAAACSGGGSTIQPPPPTGKFGLGSLHGTYAFMTSGEVFTNGSSLPTPLARVGSFFADGTGGISGGVEDVNASGTVSAGSAIISTSTSGSLSGYTVDPSGHGTLTLTVTSSGITTTIKFGFVLTSGSNGLSPATDGIMIDETSTQNQASTGSGNFVLQTTGVQTSGLTGTYVFDFSGLDAGGSPESIVGEISSNSGAITGGIEDSDDNFALNSSAPTGAGSFISDTSNANFGRGLVTIASQEYAFYIVDPTRVRLISTTTTATTPPMLSGDAILQTSPPPASLSGGFAFVVAGANTRGAITRVGRFSVSGSSVPNNSVLMDTNDSDNFFLTGGTNGKSVSGASISLDSTTGRGTLTFRDTSFNAPSTFVFYLTSSSSGVFQETTQVSGVGPIVVADGSIEGQSGNPFTSSNITGNYAVNWSGLVTSGGNGITDEEDLAGLVTISSLSLSGASDMFQFTSFNLQPLTNLGTKGQINLNGGTGAGDDGKRVDMTVNLSNTSPIDMVVYIVSPQTAFFANRMNDSGRIIVGVLQAQR